MVSKVKTYILGYEYNYIFDYYPTKYFSLDKKKSSFQTSFFEDKVTKMILEYKKDGSHSYFFGDFIIDILKEQNLEYKNLIFLPVPCSNASKYSIRYKTISEYICTKLKMENGYDYLTLNRSCLEAKNGERDRKEYKSLLKAKIPSCKFEGKDILLFDDVLTTGTTIEVIAEFLETYKVKSIRVITLGKTYDRLLRGKFEYYFGLEESRQNNNYEEMSIDELKEKGDYFAIDQLMFYLEKGTPYEIQQAADAISKSNKNIQNKKSAVIKLLIRNLNSKYIMVRESSLEALTNFKLEATEFLEIKKILEELYKKDLLETNMETVKKLYKLNNTYHNFICKRNFKALKNQKDYVFKLIEDNNTYRLKEISKTFKNIDYTFTTEIFDKTTYLGVAVSEGKIEIAKILIESGANVNLLNALKNQEMEVSALYLAVNKNDLDMARLLLESQANPKDIAVANVDPDYVCFLEFSIVRALEIGNMEMIKLILSYTPNLFIDSENTQGQICSELASVCSLVLEYGNLELIKILQEKGVDFDRIKNDNISPRVKDYLLTNKTEIKNYSIKQFLENLKKNQSYEFQNCTIFPEKISITELLKNLKIWKLCETNVSELIVIERLKDKFILDEENNNFEANSYSSFFGIFGNSKKYKGIKKNRNEIYFNPRGQAFILENWEILLNPNSHFEDFKHTYKNIPNELKFNNNFEIHPKRNGYKLDYEKLIITDKELSATNSKNNNKDILNKYYGKFSIANLNKKLQEKGFICKNKLNLFEATPLGNFYGINTRIVDETNYYLAYSSRGQAFLLCNLGWILDLESWTNSQIIDPLYLEYALN